MRAVVSDPQGPRRWRAIPFVPALVLGVGTAAIGIAGVASSTTLGWLAWLAFFVSGIGALVPTRRRSKRSAVIEVGPGFVTIAKAGVRSQRIVAKDITGATTARSSTGVVLTLAHKHRDQPIELEVESEDHAEQVRRALGIGHGGFGAIGWRTSDGHRSRADLAARLVWFACFAGMGLAAALTDVSALATLASGLLNVYAIAAAVMLYMNLAKPPPPTVTMMAAGLELRTAIGVFFAPWSWIKGYEADAHRLVFHVPEPHHRVEVAIRRPLFGGITESERQSLLLQVGSALQRANGLGPLKDDAEARLDVLRRHGESVRQWLDRLDTAGRMLETSGGAGYRGSTLDVHDLWRIVEDPDADVDVRAAAARVLRHSTAPGTKVRIDAAIATVREELVHKKLRVAVTEDIDTASAEFAVLDQYPAARAVTGVPR